MHIMILDDNPEIIELMTTMLHSAFGKDNCQIVTGHNGLDGLALLNQVIPDVIFTNLRMPQMDGLTFASQLRSRSDCDHIHLVMVSALANPEVMADARARGVEAFIRKPFTLRDLKLAVSRLMEA